MSIVLDVLDTALRILTPVTSAPCTRHDATCLPSGYATDTWSHDHLTALQAYAILNTPCRGNKLIFSFHQLVLCLATVVTVTLLLLCSTSQTCSH